jgi:hypothetical protein
MKLITKVFVRTTAFAVCALTLSACNSDQSAGSAGTAVSAPITNGGTSTVTSTGGTSGTPAPTHSATPTPTAAPVTTTGSYPSCVSSDTTHICIGLKIVAYESTAGVPTLTEAQAVTLVDGMNTIWSQCNVGFQLEVYQSINPATLGLPSDPNWDTQTDAIRDQFASNTQFLVVAVSALSGSTIAVTRVPYSYEYGTIVEAAYATNPMTVGHELGHYQGLAHVSDSTNLMNPYIGADTRTLTASQCATSISTDSQYWAAMKRTP